MVKLDPPEESYQLLLDTMHRFNEACNAIAEVVFEMHSASKRKILKATYYDIRAKYGLSSQLTVRAISKVAEAYKQDKSLKPHFRPDGAIVYDERILSWKGLENVSLITLESRQIVPTIIGYYQRDRLANIRGQADLVLIKNIFYICVVIESSEEPTYDPVDVIGIDLGVENIAVDSYGETYSSRKIRDTRKRSDGLKARLPRCGTKSSKRYLKKLSGRMAGFAKDVNHCISKNLIMKAKDTCSLMSLEDLEGIRNRTTVSKAQRHDHASWSFGQLREFLTYKAAIAGVPLVFVDPAYTSQECPICHCISRSNRPTRDGFACTCGGFSGPADTVAALNIRARVAVNLPIVSRFVAQAQAQPFRTG